MTAPAALDGVQALATLPGVRPLTQASAAARTGALPVVDGLSTVLPGGLRRGATVEVSGDAGVMSLVLALLGGPSAHGSWSAAVGFPLLSADAAAGYGIDLSRFALVPRPGPDWTTVVGALLDSVDVVAVRLPSGPVRLTDGDARRLAARARRHGSVLIPVPAPGGSGVARSSPVREPAQPAWPRADVRLRVELGDPSGWEGLEAGYGRLRCRRVRLRASGRGGAARPRSAPLWLPDPLGAASAGPAEPAAPPSGDRTGSHVTSLARFAAHRSVSR